ncbi:hypothetical protein E4T47_02616 [Aureobasidium subglaciale]|nr:hypothetical protein E4T47_02616 [Aureobasidium subglaciale]
MAAPKTQSVFEEYDDCASVNTDSTAESEAKDEYSVERILAEKNDEGYPQYLVKWEGYGLHRATWEPVENFVDPDSLDNWERFKRDIKAGKKRPFRLSRFEDAVEEDEKKREKRHARCEEKRRKKALSRTSPTKSRESTPRRRLVPKKTLIKKGLARKAERSESLSESPRRQLTRLFEPSTPDGSTGLKRKRSQVNSRSPPPALSVNDPSNSQYSMFNETSTGSPRTSSTLSTTASKRTRVVDSINPAKSNGKISKQQPGIASNVALNKHEGSNVVSGVPKKPQLNEVPVARSTAVGSSARPQPSGMAKSSTEPELSKSSGTAIHRRASDGTPALALVRPKNTSNNAAAENRLDPSTSADGTVPKTIPRPAGPSRLKPPINIFIGAKARPRQRTRVSEYTPKDSTDPQFVNLSTRSRMQNYGHNEPAPDPNALEFIDPSTGKLIDNTVRGLSASHSLQLDINVARVSESVGSATTSMSAPALPNRSVSSSEPPWEPLNARPTPRLAQIADPRPAYPSAQPSDLARPSRKRITCRFWYRGTCKKSEADCHHAHALTGQLDPKKPATCSFWENNRCRFTDEECEYFHGYDFEQQSTSTRSVVVEDVNGFRAIQQARNRSESPDRYGLRQDEAEGRRERPSLPHVSGRLDERAPVLPPSMALTASFETTGSPARDPPAENTGTDVATPDTAPSFDVAMPDVQDEEVLSPIDIRLGIKPATSPAYAMGIRLSFDSGAGRTKALDTIGANSTLKCSELCRSRDFEAYWYSNDKSWASGGATCTSGDPVAKYLEEFLILHSSGVVARTDDYVLVVYPTQNPDWKLMPHRGPEKPGLRWYLQAASPGALEPIITKPTKSSFTSICAEHLSLTSEVLFAGNKGKKVEKVVYLFFPREAPETKLIEAFLVDVGAKFSHSDDLDLFNQFCGKGTTANRVVLFHPSMNAFWKLSGFWNVLATSINIFQVGISRTIKFRPDSPLAYDCTRLFPSGTLTLITDDVFKYQPALALRVLTAFVGYKIKPEGGRNDRIYCRPGILAWLAELIDEDREKSLLHEDSPRVKCWHLACELLGTPVADNNRNPFRVDMSPPPMLYSPPKSEMPNYGPSWDSSEEEATDFLVGWFAGHCVDECENYRRFHVLYEQHGTSAAQTPGLLQPENPKDPKEWMKKFTHLKVTTPARYMVHLEQYEKSKTKPH